MVRQRSAGLRRYCFVTKVQEVCGFVILKLSWVTSKAVVAAAGMASTEDAVSAIMYLPE